MDIADPAITLYDEIDKDPSLNTCFRGCFRIVDVLLEKLHHTFYAARIFRHFFHHVEGFRVVGFGFDVHFRRNDVI